MMVSGGFPEESVEVAIHNRRRGIARDILVEAGNGYEFVVTCRRGMGALAGVIVGSVTLKLLQGLTFAPLLIAGQKAAGNRVLIGFDGSTGAMRALRFVGNLLAPFPEYEVCLIHVLRAAEEDPSGFRGILLPKDYAPYVGETIMRKMEAARSKLVSLGVAPERITSRIVPGALSRSAEIVKYAKAENFGIIALGRRGVSHVRDFFIGRVTNKVLHLARDRSVWIVQ
jgi:nucleotide-binding universal stress UspA family protein